MANDIAGILMHGPHAEALLWAVEEWLSHRCYRNNARKRHTRDMGRREQKEKHAHQNQERGKQRGEKERRNARSRHPPTPARPACAAEVLNSSAGGLTM